MRCVMTCRFRRYRTLKTTARKAITISAFLQVSVNHSSIHRHLPNHRLLLVEFVASTTAGRTAESALARKDKKPLPLPVSPIKWRFSVP